MINFCPDQQQKTPEPAPWNKNEGPVGDGPRTPLIDKPDTKNLLKKMRKIDPNQSQKYRQRTGQ